MIDDLADMPSTIRSQNKNLSIVPKVSIIIPCYNEVETIRLLLDSLSSQTFSAEKMEVVIADGMSTDGTREQIKEWSNDNPNKIIRIVNNIERNIPSGINRAIGAANGEYLVRLDAHSMPNHDYVENSIKALQKDLGDNVGGLWRIKPGGIGFIACSIAAAASNPLGVGGAQYRVGGEAQAVDTVPFGAFRKELVERIGLYDETLLSNEDYEYNARIRKAGGVVWFDPKIQSAYFARTTMGELARQYWRYGYWKFQMLRRYPRTIRWRQGLPPLFVLSLIGLGLLSIWFEGARIFLLIEIVIYVLALVFGGLLSAIENSNWKMILGVPLAIVTMHLSWGVAFLWSCLKTLFDEMEIIH